MFSIILFLNKDINFNLNQYIKTSANQHISASIQINNLILYIQILCNLLQRGSMMTNTQSEMVGRPLADTPFLKGFDVRFEEPEGIGITSQRDRSSNRFTFSDDYEPISATMKKYLQFDVFYILQF